MGNTQKLPPLAITQEVIDGVNGELSYQSILQDSGRADAREHGVEGQLVTLKVYADEAMVAWVKNPGDDAALDALRKVAAIAIRPLIQYGCPPRKSKPLSKKWALEKLQALKQAFLATNTVAAKSQDTWKAVSLDNVVTALNEIEWLLVESPEN